MIENVIAHHAVKVAETAVTGRLSFWREDLQRGAYVDLEIPAIAWQTLRLDELVERYIEPAMMAMQVRLSAP